MSQRGSEEAGIFPDDDAGTVFFLIPAFKGQINKVLIKAKLSRFVRPHHRAHPITLGVTASSIEQPLLRKVNFAICYVICQQNYKICSNK